MGLLIKYSGSLLLLVALALVIFRMLRELGIINDKALGGENKKQLLQSSLFVVCMQAAVFFAGFVIFQTAHEKMNFFSFDKIWLYGDAKSFADYAAGGFPKGVFQYSSISPFYTSLLRLIGDLMKNSYLLAGMLISTASMIIACFYLYKLVILDFDKNIAHSAVKLILLFPFAFYTFLSVPDALFLALTVAAYYYLRNEKWFLCGILSLLAVLCDLRGLLLFIPFIYEVAMRKEKSTKMIFTFLCLLSGGFIFLGYQQSQFQSMFAFLGHTSDSFSFFRFTWGGDYKIIWGEMLPTLVLLGATVILCVQGAGIIRTSYLLYAIATCWIPYFLIWYDNRPRHFIAAFPFFIVAALLCKNKTVNMVLTYLSIILCGLYLFYFISFRIVI